MSLQHTEQRHKKQDPEIDRLLETARPTIPERIVNEHDAQGGGAFVAAKRPDGSTRLGEFLLHRRTVR
jgi:hypothetical protein